MDKKKVLILGSMSFFFSNFIRKALYEKQPYEFVSIDRVNSGNPSSIYVNKDHRFYIGDISDSHFMNVIFQNEKPNIVIHGVEDRVPDSKQFINSNILGTQITIDNCKKYNIEKLIYLSNDKIYGELETESDASWTENDPINPLTSLMVAKSASELLIKISGINYNILRLSNLLGPRQKSNKLITKTIKSILNNEKICVLNQGLEIRNWTHVNDACSALLQILANGKENEIYNISSGQEFNNIEVIQRICNIMESGHNSFSYMQDIENRAFRYSTDFSKIKELGWKPEFKLNTGLEETIKWFINNKWALQ